MLNIYAVGHPWPGKIPPVGIRFEFDGDHGARIILGFRNPTPLEIHQAKIACLRLGLVSSGDHTTFLLVQNLQYPGGWADAPFSWGKVAPHQRYFETDEAAPSTTGYLFRLYLTDQFGIIRAIRMFTVTPRFSEALNNALRGQERHVDSWSVDAHNAEIAAAYRRWSTSKQMAKAATIIEEAGVPFDTNEASSGIRLA